MAASFRSSPTARCSYVSRAERVHFWYRCAGFPSQSRPFRIVKRRSPRIGAPGKVRCRSRGSGASILAPRSHNHLTMQRSRTSGWCYSSGSPRYVLHVMCCTADSLTSIPGAGDSNRARVQVAEKWMKDCKFFFIVAPIQRAVDDKIARGE